MYLATECPCCGGKEFASRPAIVAPFVAERALGRAPTRCRLLECRGCKLRFFDVRLDDQELARLYAGYRGDDYFRQRHRHEFWYTRKANQSLGDDPRVLATRRAALQAFIEAHLDPAAIDTVLDYGGDRGQVIPPALGRARFVSDLSGVTPVDGVTNLGAESALLGRTFDLVLLSHVLEHASEPRALLEKLRPLGRNLYVEVPLERPWLGGTLRGRWGERWLDALLRVPPLLRAADFYATTFRVGAGLVPPLGFTKAHEHLNFFVEPALRALLFATGFEVIACETRIILKQAVITCLARRRI